MTNEEYEEIAKICNDSNRVEQSVICQLTGDKLRDLLAISPYPSPESPSHERFLEKDKEPQREQ